MRQEEQLCLALTLVSSSSSRGSYDEDLNPLYAIARALFYMRKSGHSSMLAVVLAPLITEDLRIFSHYDTALQTALCLIGL